MFITQKYAGYNRHGEQSAAGYFLILMQPRLDSTGFPHLEKNCRVCGKIRRDHQMELPHVRPCPHHGILARLEARKHGTEAELDAICNAGDRYVAGCAACEASKEYRAHCFSFTPNAISYPIRAIVRYVRMRQLGHFMMGTARIGNNRITLSGSYGGDGLPCDVPDDVYSMGVELPAELYQAWSTGGGWNSCGAEAAAMREWALKTFPKHKAQR